MPHGEREEHHKPQVNMTVVRVIPIDLGICLCFYIATERTAREVTAMSLFDPYSHTQLHRLKQDELARKARRQQQLGSDVSSIEAQFPIAAIVRVLTNRLVRHPA